MGKRPRVEKGRLPVYVRRSEIVSESGVEAEIALEEMTGTGCCSLPSERRTSPSWW